MDLLSSIKERVKLTYLIDSQEYMVLSIKNVGVFILNLNYLILRVVDQKYKTYRITYGVNYYDVTPPIYIQEFDPDTIIKYIISEILKLFNLDLPSSRIVLSRRIEINNKYIVLMALSNGLFICSPEEIKLEYTMEEKKYGIFVCIKNTIVKLNIEYDTKEYMLSHMEELRNTMFHVLTGISS